MFPRWIALVFPILILAWGCVTLLRFRRRIVATTPNPAVLELTASRWWSLLPLLCVAWLSLQTIMILRQQREFQATSEVADKIAEATKSVKISTTSGPVARTIPSWIMHESVPSETIVLHSGFYITRAEAEAELWPLANALLRQHYDAQFGRKGPWEFPNTLISPQFIKQQYLETTPLQTGKFDGNMLRLHVQLDVSQTALKHLTDIRREQIAEHRIGLVGGWLSWLILSMAILAGYIGSTIQSPLIWPSKLAAVGLICLVTAGISLGWNYQNPHVWQHAKGTLWQVPTSRL